MRESLDLDISGGMGKTRHVRFSPQGSAVGKGERTRVQILEFARPADWAHGDGPLPERVLYERHLLIFEQIRDNQDLFRLMVREARARNPETENRVRKAQHAIVSTMAAEMKAGTRAGHYHCPDPEFTAACLFGGILEIVE